MDTKSPECWSCDPKTACLRVVPDAKSSFILPYAHFIYAESHSDDDGGELKLVFATHEVVLKGHLLDRLETGIAVHEVSEIRALPERYRKLAGDRPFIRELSIVTAPQESEAN